MASSFKPFFIALQDKLVTDVPDSEGTPGIRQADPDFGQIDIEGQRPAVAFPWVGINFNETQYEQMQLNQQRAKVRITLRLAFDPWSSSSSLAPETARQKAFAYFDIEDKIYTALQNWVYEYQAGRHKQITGLRRLSAITENRKDTLHVRVLVFEGTFVDNSLNE